MLANWMFFWDEVEWVPAPAPAPAPEEQSESRGGGGHNKKRYIPHDSDYWELRERYLRRMVPKVLAIAKASSIEKDNLTSPREKFIVEALPPGGGAVLKQQAMQAALAAAQAAQDALVLQAALQRAMQLAIDISEIRKQYYSRAIALLLLDVL